MFFFLFFFLFLLFSSMFFFCFHLLVLFLRCDSAVYIILLLLLFIQLVLFYAPTNLILLSFSILASISYYFISFIYVLSTAPSFHTAIYTKFYCMFLLTNLVFLISFIPSNLSLFLVIISYLSSMFVSLHHFPPTLLFMLSPIFTPTNFILVFFIPPNFTSLSIYLDGRQTPTPWPLQKHGHWNFTRLEKQKA